MKIKNLPQSSMQLTKCQQAQKHLSRGGGMYSLWEEGTIINFFVSCWEGGGGQFFLQKKIVLKKPWCTNQLFF